MAFMARGQNLFPGHPGGFPLRTQPHEMRHGRFPSGALLILGRNRLGVLLSCGRNKLSNGLAVARDRNSLATLDRPQ